MQIKFVVLRSQADTIRDESDNAIAGVTHNTASTLGPAAKEYEQTFAECIGVVPVESFELSPHLKTGRIFA